MNSRGFALATVVILLTLIAAAVFLVTREAATGSDRVSRSQDAAAARYTADAGLTHALWLADNSGCSGYGLPTTAFGSHSYMATFTPTADSPVTVSVKGATDSGASADLVRQGVPVFDGAPQVLMLQPGASGTDTYIRDGANDSNNFGAASILKLNNQSAEEASLLEFDLSGLGGAQVISATLELWLEGGQGLTNGVIDAHRITQAWVEGDKDGQAPTPGTGATYISYNGQTNWASAGGDYATPALDTETIPTLVQGWHQWDLTSAAQGWVSGATPNNGVLLRASGGNVDKIWFTSGDGNPVEHPKLTVEYVCECGQVCGLDPNAPYAHWKLDDGSGPTAVDSVGSHDGMLVSNPAWVAGKLTGGLDFDGVDDYVDAGTFDVAGSGLTMTGWFNAETIPTSDGRIVSKADGPNDFNAWWQLSTTDSGSNRYLRMRIKAGGTTTTLADSSVNLSTGQWYFAVATYDVTSGEMKLYLDGAEVASRAHDVGGPVDAGPTVPVAVGANGTAERFFDGVLDDVRVYDRALSASEISDLFDAGNAGGGNLLFVVGNVDGPGMTAEETAHQALVESWGYTVEIIDDGASQMDFYTALLNNDVVFITNDITASTLGTKLIKAPIGVVTSEDNLSDEFGLSSSIAWDSGTVLEVNDNTHYITSPFAPGLLTILSTSESLAYVTGTLSPDLGRLASSASGYGVVTLDAGATTFGGDPAAGRRVQLPWGGNGFDPNHLTTDGLTILQRSLEWGVGALGDAGPMAHWKLDDAVGNRAVDSVGGHDGTLNNGPAWVTGQLAGALDFDGTDDYVDLTADAELDDVFLGGATVIAWINPAGWGENGYGRVFDKSSSPSSTGNGWVIRMNVDNGGIINFGQGFSGGRGWWKIPNGSISLDNWQHIAVTYDASSTANDPLVFLDGVALLVTEVDTPSGSVSSDAGINLRLGNYAGGTTHTFDGLIDDARIYDRMLSAAEITDIAAEGGGGGGGGPACAATIADDFETDDYTGNTGTLNWNGNWVEVNESTNPSAGDEQVITQSGNLVARVRDNDGGFEGILRSADLSAFTSAVLTFDYWRDGLDNASDAMSVEVWPNGVSEWEEVLRVEGPGTDPVASPQSASIDISAFIMNDTHIRMITSPGMGNTDSVLLDNIEICLN